MPPVGGIARGDESLRISNELLRSENDQLQAELGQLRAFKSTADDQLAKQKTRIRNLEEDLTRIYRRQKREEESRLTEHTKRVESLKEQVENLNKQLEDRPLIAAETTQEMDAFVAMCTQWQSRLTTLSAQLMTQVERMEQDAVASVMHEMVQNVATQQEKGDLNTAREQLEVQWVAMREQEREVQVLVDKIQREREDTQAFEAMERRALEERVDEADKNVKLSEENSRVLLQEIAVLRGELTTLRTGNRIMSEAVWQQREEHEAHLHEQIESLTVQCEAQNVQLTLLREDLAGIQAENDELMADLAAHKQSVSANGDVLNKQLEERLEELRGQLAPSKKAVQEAAAEVETLLNRIEVLTMNVDAKAKVIEVLQHEKTRDREVIDSMQAQLRAKSGEVDILQAELSSLQQEFDAKLEQATTHASSDKSELQKQLTAKMCNWVELNRQVKELTQQLEARAQEAHDAVVEKNALGVQVAELRQRTTHHEEATRLQEQLTHAKLENQQLAEQVKTLTAELIHAEAQSTGVNPGTGSTTSDPSCDHDDPDRPLLSATILETKLAQTAVEKFAFERYLQSYIDTAEARCQSLQDQVKQLQAAQAVHRRQARDSFELLEICAQVDGCDATIRASLLDVMRSLESMS